MTVRQPGSGPIRVATYRPAEADSVLWDRLPCATDCRVLAMAPGTHVTIDTISYEGTVGDQVRAHGAVLRAVRRHRGTERRDRGGRERPPARPHRRRAACGDRPDGGRRRTPGDLVAITLLETLLRAPYGAMSDRHRTFRLCQVVSKCPNLRFGTLVDSIRG